MTTTPTLTDLAAELIDRDPSPGAPTRANLPDGRHLTLSLEVDEWSDPLDDMGDGTWTGRVEFGIRDRWTGRDRRPDGMDGRARKLRVGRGGDPVWWQVPADVPDESIPAMGAAISDLLEYGYLTATVHLWETVTDSRGKPHTVEVASASLGGIEPFPDHTYLHEIASELVGEVLG